MNIYYCVYCGEKIENEKPIRLFGNCFCHKKCKEESKEKETQDYEELLRLRQYIKNLFDLEEVPPKIEKQMSLYHWEFKISYYDIMMTLKYFYEIKNNLLRINRYSISIVPKIYEEAKEYYKKIEAAQMINSEEEIKNYKINSKVIKIKSPEVRRKIKMFDIGSQQKETVGSMIDSLF